MAQQYYTIESTAVYRSADGRLNLRLVEGEQIPMELAIDLGLDGAALAEGEFFDAATQAAIRALIADPFDLVETMPGDLATAQQTLTAQRAYLQRVWVPKRKTVTKLSIYTTATGTNFDFAILDEDWGKLAGLTAPAASVANGLTTGTLTEAFTYEPGVYYHALVADAATTGARGASPQTTIVNVGGINRSLYKDVAQNTIPATLTGLSTTGTRLWIAAHN